MSSSSSSDKVVDVEAENEAIILDDEEEEEDVGFLDGVNKKGWENETSDQKGSGRLAWRRIALLLLLLSLVAAFVGWKHVHSHQSLVIPNESSSTTASKYVFTTVHQLRMDMALASIEIMKQDTLQNYQTGDKRLDITGFVDLVEVALDNIGIRGVANGLLEAPVFADAFAAAVATTDESVTATLGVRSDRLHKIEYDNIPSERRFSKQDRYCAGCYWWLRHYTGAIVASKFVRDGSLLLEQGSTHRIDTIAAVSQQLRTAELQVQGPEPVVIDIMHGFAWQYGLETIDSLDVFPMQLARDVCGDFLGKPVRVDVLNHDVGYECQHGIGHAVWNILAKHELGTFSVHSQPIPKGDLFLSRNATCRGLEICFSAPGGYHDPSQLALQCIMGFGHTITLVGSEQVTEKTFSRFLAKLCPETLAGHKLI